MPLRFLHDLDFDTVDPGLHQQLDDLGRHARVVAVAVGRPDDDGVADEHRALAGFWGVEPPQKRHPRVQRELPQQSFLVDVDRDPEIDTSRVRARLRDITRKRSALQDELNTVTDDISSGVDYIDAHVSLLEQPYELYKRASDDVRRDLNQAIFEHIYVINDEVIGDELKSPLRELLAVERGWIAQSTESGDPSSVAKAVWSDHGPAEKATPKDGLIDEFVEALLSAPMEGVGSCSNTHMVHPPGLEPGTH